MNEFIEGALEKSTGLYCNLLIFTHIYLCFIIEMGRFSIRFLTTEAKVWFSSW